MDGVQFVQSAVRAAQYPDHHEPEIALVGRSNVGKSSLINALGGRRNEAKVSKTPGRTQTINFYKTNAGVWFVDLPGYGYAAVPGRVQRGFGPMIERYLEGRNQLIGVLHVLDARHAPTALDVQMRQYLLGHAIPTLTVGTKWDKLKRSHRDRRRGEIERALGVAVFPFSSLDGTGRDGLKGLIRDWVHDSKKLGRGED